MLGSYIVFKKEMHSALVNSLHRCGILDEDMKANLELELQARLGSGG